MICIVIGSAKSGKSMYSQNLALNLNKDSIYYIATMDPCDDEDLLRIENHIKEREVYPFKTVEVSRNISSILSFIEKDDTLLIDSLTSLLANTIFNSDKLNQNVYVNILNDIKNISSSCLNLVIVSDYIFNDSLQYDYYTENFRKQLGLLNTEICKFSDVVVECTFHNVIAHKGKVN